MVKALETIHATSVHAYADDIAVLCTGKQQATQAINIVKKWCTTNKIGLNASKSGVMRLKKRMHKSKVVQTLGDIPIVHTYKYLGVTISESLRLQVQVEKLRGKLKGFT